MHLTYLAGSGRSGSTVWALLLERQAQVVHLGEVRHVWARGVRENQLCECQQPFWTCPFWSEVVDRAFGATAHEVGLRMEHLQTKVDRMRHVPRTIAHLRGRQQAELEEFAGHLLSLYRSIAEVSGAEHLLDSSKDPSYLYALEVVGRLDPGVEVDSFHLVRDPRAVAYSWTRQRRRPEIHWEEAYMDVYKPGRSARLWLEVNSLCLLHARLFGSLGRHRYESFVVDPEGVVGQMCSAAGWAARGTDGGRAEVLGHSFSGNPMRFGRNGEPVRISADDAWRRELPVRQQRMVAAVTAPLLLRFGYPWR